MWLWLELSRPDVKVVLGNDAQNKLLCYAIFLYKQHYMVAIGVGHPIGQSEKSIDDDKKNLSLNII